jgi:hypothetical protein
MAARFMACVCGSSNSGTAGSNSAGIMQVCFLRVVFFGGRQACLRQADHSYRGVLPSVVCLIVVMIPRQKGSSCTLGEENSVLKI